MGINTGYIETNDYDVEDGDKDFLWEVNTLIFFYAHYCHLLKIVNS